MGLRVLQICEATNSGVGRHTTDLIGGLLDAGCDVHLIYSPTRIDGAFEQGVDKLRAKGLKTELLMMKRKPHPQDGLAVAALRRYMKKHGPFDIVHGQSSKGGALARLAGATARTPAIYTPHCIVTMAPTFGRLMRSAYRWVEWMLAFPTSMIIAASQDEYDHIRLLGVPESKVRLVRYGIEPPPETDQLVLRNSLGLSPEALIVGFVGRFSAQKNPEMLLNAFADAARDLPQARLAMIGTGELETELRSLAEALGIAGRIDWLGYRIGYHCMPAFDILAVPSRYEALPYVMLEGISVGLPLVITPVGGVRGVIESGQNGFVVPSEDTPAMTKALRDMLTSPALRQQFASAARYKAVEFRLETMVGKTLDVYDHCRARRKAKLAATL